MNIKQFILAFLSFSLVISVGELGLRAKYTPGYFTHYSDFIVVDSLIVYEDYTTDQWGNYVLSKAIVEDIKQDYNYENCEISSENRNRIANPDGVGGILEDFCSIKNLSEHKYPFEKFALDIMNSNDRSVEDSAYLSYIRFPFNHSGFKSIPFQNHQSDQLKVLLVGDSFTWGMTAKPYYNCFADLLATNNYMVYNAGIASVDPIQYYNICKAYTEMVEPDIVIVNYFEGNDLLKFDRTPEVGKPHEHITNAGFFDSHPEGEYLSAEDAYTYYENLVKIPSNTFWSKLCSKTSIGSIIWSKFVPEAELANKNILRLEEKTALTHSYILKTQQFLDSLAIPVVFSVIPYNQGQHNENHSSILCDTHIAEAVFQDISYHTPENLTIDDFNYPKDYHFNNLGSAKYANFVDSIIQLKLHIE